jgi:hypothetical protein
MSGSFTELKMFIKIYQSAETVQDALDAIRRALDNDFERNDIKHTVARLKRNGVCLKSFPHIPEQKAEYGTRLSENQWKSLASYAEGQNS